MAARTMAVSDIFPLDLIASTATGSDPGADIISIVFDDADSKARRQHAFEKLRMKLIEEGWI